MKLNWAERLVVNNPFRVMEQALEIQWFKRKMFLNKEAVLLEIGCGRGAGARLINEAFRPHHLFIMDVDIVMIQMAKAYFSCNNREKISMYVGDAASLPFRTGSLDAVFGFGFLHHVPDWRKALQEIARILKTGGVYFMEELFPSLYQNFITKHILQHPNQDRFFSYDLRKALAELHLILEEAIEFKKLGILGIAKKGR